MDLKQLSVLIVLSICIIEVNSQVYTVVPNFPVCITNYYNKDDTEPFFLECISEIGHPRVNLRINVDLCPDIYTENGTHVRQKIVIDKYESKDISEYICIAYQNDEPPYKGCLFTDAKPKSNSAQTVTTTVGSIIVAMATAIQLM